MITRAIDRNYHLILKSLDDKSQGQGTRDKGQNFAQINEKNDCKFKLFASNSKLDQKLPIHHQTRPVESNSNSSLNGGNAQQI
jgi:hypothetical protein